MEKKIVKYSTIKAAETDDKRILRFIGSDSKIDRDGDVVDATGWNLKEYKKNPVVLVGHNYKGLPVAKTKKVWVDKDTKQLMFDIEFPEASVSAEGDTLYKLYKGGFMSATSVGFIPDYKTIEYPKDTKGPNRIIRSAELLEISLVSVPANPRALLSTKSIEEAKRQEVVDDLEINQLLKWLGEDNGIEEKLDTTTDDILDKGVDDKVIITDLQKCIEDLKKDMEALKKQSYIHSLYDDFKDLGCDDCKDSDDGWMNEWIEDLSK